MFSKLLLAFDGTREGRQALREAAALARRVDAKVHLLSVVHLTPGELLAESSLPGALVEFDEAEMDKVVQEGLAELRRAGLTAEGTLSRGPNPARDIADVARRIGADLIVLGHRNQGTLARLWNGSVGQQLIAHAPCSVLVAIAPAPTRRQASAAA
jgi:nucleotide-binding universal stress UspA family protein